VNALPDDVAKGDLSPSGGATLVLVVGPSGAGKDTLIDAAKAHFAGVDRLWFPRRLITRPQGPGEDHTFLSDEAFDKTASANGFFLHWAAHGVRYGLPSEVSARLGSGCNVVVNVSRRVIGDAMAKWSDVRVVNVTAAREILAARLRARGRETASEIAERVARATQVAVPGNADVDDVDNSADLGQAQDAFVALLAAYMKGERRSG